MTTERIVTQWTVAMLDRRRMEMGTCEYRIRAVRAPSSTKWETRIEFQPPGNQGWYNIPLDYYRTALTHLAHHLATKCEVKHKTPYEAPKAATRAKKAKP